ncbi:MAG: helix-turn-helix transcriptional regulator [Candidatus Saccharimonadales bacterium]
MKDARNKLGLTQQEVADMSGIHWNTYAKIERDEQEPSFDTVKRLAKVLKLKLEDIPS